jgi:hypothetical protein
MASCRQTFVDFLDYAVPGPISPLVEPYLDASALQKRDEAFS